MSGLSQSGDVDKSPCGPAVALYALIFYLSHRDAAIFIIHTPNIAELLGSRHSEPHVSAKQPHKTELHAEAPFVKLLTQHPLSRTKKVTSV